MMKCPAITHVLSVHDKKKLVDNFTVQNVEGMRGKYQTAIGRTGILQNLKIL